MMMTVAEWLLSLELGLIYGFVAIGIMITFRILDFPDLTCDGSFVCGAAVSGVLLQAGVNPWLSLMAAAAAGSAAGLTTGLLVTRLAITELLAGILVSFMLYSVNLHVMGDMPNLALTADTVFTDFSPWWVLCGGSAAVGGLVAYLLVTNFGLALRCIGQNPRLAEASGVDKAAMTLFGLALSNSLIALGGALFSQSLGFVDVGSGVGTVIMGLASVMIGEKILPFSSMWSQVVACMVGSLVYRLLIGAALHSDALGLQSSDVNLITGVLVVAIMVMPRGRYVDSR